MMDDSPLYFPLLSSCRRVLDTSMGCSRQASTMPPVDPAQQAPTCLLVSTRGAHC